MPFLPFFVCVQCSPRSLFLLLFYSAQSLGAFCRTMTALQHATTFELWLFTLYQPLAVRHPNAAYIACMSLCPVCVCVVDSEIFSYNNTLSALSIYLRRSVPHNEHEKCQHLTPMRHWFRLSRATCISDDICTIFVFQCIRRAIQSKLPISSCLPPSLCLSACRGRESVLF